MQFVAPQEKGTDLSHAHFLCVLFQPVLFLLRVGTPLAKPLVERIRRHVREILETLGISPRENYALERRVCGAVAIAGYLHALDPLVECVTDMTVFGGFIFPLGRFLSLDLRQCNLHRVSRIAQRLCELLGLLP